MKIPPPLLEDIATGRCLPFVGAGFSLNAKLPDKCEMPDWPGLANILAEALGISEKPGELEVASSYERRFGRVQLIEAIRKALHADTAEPGKAHRVFAQLPFDTIYTTNFDLLLEDANGLLRRPYRSIVGELQMPFHGGPLSTTIVKMHGDLRHEEHIIVTKDDYRDYLNRYPVISTHLSSMLITKTALFIGYSLSDPDFNHIREVVRSRLGRFQRMSYIIQFNQSDSNIEKMLDDSLHVINFKVKRGESIDEKLASFFAGIQDKLDTSEGKKLRAAKPEIFEKMTDEAFEAASKSPDAATLLSSSSNLCFVLMPFGEPFDYIYNYVIRPAILSSGLEPMRADQMYSPGSIMEQIRAAIQQSRLCIADLTGRNPNVLYELGIAQTLGKPTVLLSQDMDDVPFDVRQYRVINYVNDIKGIDDAKEMLIKYIQSVLGLDRLDEAKQLIQNGMLRAGAAILGILLEHSLRLLLLRYELLELGGRLLSMGKMIEILLEAKVISQNDLSSLREAIGIRNRAVHELAEPTAKQAETLLQTVERFVNRFIRNADPPVNIADPPLTRDK